MDFVLKANEMRAADIYSSEVLNINTYTLMLNAASALVCEAEKLIEYDKSKKILILCGKGNNGGDGIAALDILIKKGYTVECVAVFGKNFSGAALTAYENCDKRLVFDYSDEIFRSVKDSDLIIDCIFGTGFNGVLKSETAKLISTINLSHAKKISCDVPSGCSCDDGKVFTVAVKADVTVTFAAYKPCFFLYPACDYCGQVIVSDINLPNKSIDFQNPQITLIKDSLIRKLIKSRPENSHKGTFGKVQLVCGSKMMTGAAVLAAKGALRSGVGLVYIESGSYVRKRLQTQLSEPVYVKKKRKTKAGAYVIGCGLGKRSKRLKKLIKQEKSMVVDADALSYLAKHPRIIKKKHCEIILTPHPLELARLCNTTVDIVESDRIKAALVSASDFNSTVVLKGHYTIIATPNGEVYINTTGNSGLAKGGSGDVLSGLIGSLLAQGYSTKESAILGVYLHGKAADNLKIKISEAGMLPSDIPEEIGVLLKNYEVNS